MSETAVLKSNGTIGSFAEMHKEAETTTNNNATVETTSDNNAVETSDSSVNQSGDIVNGASNVAQEATNVAEANESNFSFGFEDETSNVATDATQQQQVQEVNLDEILKKYDRKEVAKKLGLTDFALEIDEHLARGGNAMDYLQAKAVDWDKVSDLDILKAEFAKKYYMLDAAMQEHVFNKKYGISDLDDDEVKNDKLINQKIDAAEIRRQKKEEQAKFKLPEAKTQQEVSKEFTEWQQTMQRQQQESEAAKQFITSHPAIQSLLTSKRVAIDLGEGVKPFNFNIDKPDLIVKAILDGSFYRKFITNKQGELDVERLKKITLYAADPDRHDRDLFNYGKSHGVQTLVNEGQNAKKPDGITASPDLGNKEVKVTGSGKLGQHIRNR
jgi:hypothetical protein